MAMVRGFQWVAENSLAKNNAVREATVIRKINALLELQQVVGSLTEVRRMWHTIASPQDQVDCRGKGRKNKKRLPHATARTAGRPAVRSNK